MEYEKTYRRVRTSGELGTDVAGLDFTSKEEKTPVRFSKSFVLRGRPS
jgi:hypothetical protein